jgi:hypothetical protein
LRERTPFCSIAGVELRALERIRAEQALEIELDEKAPAIARLEELLLRGELEADEMRQEAERDEFAGERLDVVIAAVREIEREMRRNAEESANVRDLEAAQLVMLRLAWLGADVS